MSTIEPKIEESWKSLLLEEFKKDYFKKLKHFLMQEKKQHSIYPKGIEIFNAFNLTPLRK